MSTQFDICAIYAIIMHIVLESGTSLNASIPKAFITWMTEKSVWLQSDIFWDLSVLLKIVYKIKTKCEGTNKRDFSIWDLCTKKRIGGRNGCDEYEESQQSLLMYPCDFVLLLAWLHYIISSMWYRLSSFFLFLLYASKRNAKIFCFWKRQKSHIL